MSLERQRVTETVSRFYRELPFNYEHTVEQAAQTIREQNQIASAYPPLDEALKQAKAEAILDVGSGAGWFINTAAYYYGVTATGVDVCEPALTRASAVAEQLGLALRTQFVCEDLFALGQRSGIRPGAFALVNSLGVLHHTHHCRQALEHIAPFVAPGGFLHLGLYHAYGRRPFLELFEEDVRAWRATDDGVRRQVIEERAFQRYRILQASITDEVLLRSWFRDQVLHPQESQHTFHEVYGWLTALGLTCRATSLNRFQAVSDWSSLFEEEKRWYAVSYQRNVRERTYFPGFFVVLAQRPLR